MLRYPVEYCPKLLQSLTAEWLELLPSILGITGLNPKVSGVITKKFILAAGFIQSTLLCADTHCRLCLRTVTCS